MARAAAAMPAIGSLQACHPESEVRRSSGELLSPPGPAAIALPPTPLDVMVRADSVVVVVATVVVVVGCAIAATTLLGRVVVGPFARVGGRRTTVIPATSAGIAVVVEVGSDVDVVVGTVVVVGGSVVEVVAVVVVVDGSVVEVVAVVVVVDGFVVEVVAVDVVVDGSVVDVVVVTEVVPVVGGVASQTLSISLLFKLTPPLTLRTRPCSSVPAPRLMAESATTLPATTESGPIVTSPVTYQKTLQGLASLIRVTELVEPIASEAALNMKIEFESPPPSSVSTPSRVIAVPTWTPCERV